MSSIDTAESLTMQTLQDDTHPMYEELYQKNRTKFFLDLPVFYVSIQPAHTASIFPPRVIWHGVNNQYHKSIGAMLTGDQWYAIKDGKPIQKKIGMALSWSFMLACTVLLITIVLGIPLGYYLAIHHEKRITRWIDLLGDLILSTPVFWSGTIAVIVFTTSLYGSLWNWFPSPGIWDIRGSYSFWEQVTRNIGMLTLPLLVLVLPDLVYFSKLVKTSLRDESNKPYTTPLLSKGLSRKQMYTKHLLPNALSPIITAITSSVPLILSGALVVEVLFNIPGMGRLLYDSILFGDWNVILPIVSIMAFVTMISYLIGDILLAWINPKSSKVAVL